jgi:hypothetical protein
VRLSETTFNTGFQKLVLQFQPRLPKGQEADFRRSYFEAVNDLTEGEWMTCVQVALRESKYMPKPAELHGFNARHSAAPGTPGEKKSHWYEGPVTRWKDQHGHWHHGMQHEPKPWRSYRLKACPRCSACMGQGFAPDTRRTDPPIGHTAGGIRVFPCACTRRDPVVEEVMADVDSPL